MMASFLIWAMAAVGFCWLDWVDGWEEIWFGFKLRGWWLIDKDGVWYGDNSFQLNVHELFEQIGIYRNPIILRRSNCQSDYLCLFSH